MSMIIQELVAKLGFHVDASSFKAAEAMMNLARGGMVAIGTAAVAVAGGLAAAVAKTAQHADAIEKAAQRTGIGVEALQALQYAAERADVGTEGLQGALNFMAKRGVKDFETELRRAADELAAMPDGGAKAARAMQLFGKQGAALIPMLNKGSAGLDEMTQKARDMGLVMGVDVVRAGAETKDAIEDLQGFLRGLAYTIAGPFLEPVREWLTSAAKWIKANREIIAQRFEKVIGLVATALKYTWQLLKPIASLLATVAGNVWVMRAAAAALAFTLLQGLGSAASSAGAALLGLAKGLAGMTAAGIGAALVPVLIGAALLALALVAEDVYQFLQGNDSLMGTLGVKYTEWLDQVLAIDPADSPLMKGLKGILQVVFDLQGALMKLDTWIRRDSAIQNAVNGAVATGHYVLSGAAAALPGEMGTEAGKRRDARWSEMGFYGGRLSGNVRDAAVQSWADSAKYDPSAWTSATFPTTNRLPTAGAPGPSITLNGGVTINATPETDGAKVAGDFVSEVKRLIGVELRTEYVTALPAVVGP